MKKNRESHLVPDCCTIYFIFQSSKPGRAGALSFLFPRFGSKPMEGLDGSGQGRKACNSVCVRVHAWPAPSIRFPYFLLFLLALWVLFVFVSVHGVGARAFSAATVRDLLLPLSDSSTFVFCFRPSLLPLLLAPIGPTTEEDSLTN